MYLLFIIQNGVDFVNQYGQFYFKQKNFLINLTILFSLG
jgi:hypothetical protein